MKPLGCRQPDLFYPLGLCIIDTLKSNIQGAVLISKQNSHIHATYTGKNDKPQDIVVKAIRRNLY